MQVAPHITVTDPKNAVFKVELRFGGWPRLREIVDHAECGIVERRTGWITKEFSISGDEAALNRFVSAMWNDDLLGQQFRLQMRALGVKRDV